MKHNASIIIGTLSALALCACAADVVYDIPFREQYDNLYLVQSSSNPHTVYIDDTQKEDKVESFNAFYSGMTAPTAIRMTIAVDPSLVETFNRENNKQYALLPESAYTLSASQSVIPAGEFRTEMIPVRFRMTDDLQVGASYVLPLRLSTEDVKVRADMSVLYYVVSVTKDMSPVPVKGTVDPCNMFFMVGGGKTLLTLNEASGELARYSYDAENDVMGAKEVLFEDWGPTRILRGMISSCAGNTLHIVNTYANWIALQVSEDGSTVPSLSEYASFITGGCGIFLSCIPGHPDGFLAIDAATGGIRYYQLTPDGLSLTGVGSFDEKFNYWPYAVRFCFNYDIYGVDGDGALWRHVYDASSHTWAEREKVGSGWGAYTNICQEGENLLAKKADGSLMRIPFDPDN